jgi:hypothetical protein
MQSRLTCSTALNARSAHTTQIQVHDYRSVSFLRLPSETRAASKKTIEVMGAHYTAILPTGVLCK